MKDCRRASDRPSCPRKTSDIHFSETNIVDDKRALTASLLVCRTDDDSIKIHLQRVHCDERCRADTHPGQSNRLGGGVSCNTIDCEKLDGSGLHTWDDLRRT